MKRESIVQDQGWNQSAQAWIEFVEQGDLNREVILDEPVLDLLGAIEGQRVLDIGSGEGRLLRMLERRGAEVFGLDPTEALLTRSLEKSSAPVVRGVGELLPFQSESFDAVVFYLSLIDIEGFEEAIGEAARVLKSGGKIVVANLNPFVTALPFGWHRDASGERMHYPIDDYLTRKADIAKWRGIEIINYHRPMSDYLHAFLNTGLMLTAFDEPAPSTSDAAAHPNVADHLRVPLFHVMSWRKPTDV